MPAPAFRRLPRAAQAVVLSAVALAVAGTAAATAGAPATAVPPVLLAALAAACLAAALVEAPVAGGYALHPGVVPLVWAAIALPAAVLPALALLCCLPGAVRTRPRWYLPAFNVATLTLSALGAHAVARGAGPQADVIGAASVIALAGAAAAFVVVNHAALAVVVRVSGQPRPTGVPTQRPGVGLDLALALSGALLAVLWQRGELLALLAAGPLLVVGRALRVPALRLQAATDPKTGLFHLVHFDRALEDAIAAATRRDEPLSVLMVDLDHLRVINNRFGHLAGDRAIREVAQRLAAAAGAHGTAARFGGEEFCLLLPGDEVRDALPVAEALRAEVEAAGWIEHGEAVALTVSVGVAAFPQHGAGAPELMRAADAALYEAKLGGRNRVRVALAERVQRSLADELPGLEAFAPVPPPVRSLVAAPLQPFVAAAPRERPKAVPPSEPPAPAPAPPRSARLVPWYVGLLLAGAAAVAALAGVDGLTGRPWLVGALIVAVVALDAIRIDLFERGTISPASVPTLALAIVAGPIGPIAAEAAIALGRIVRRVPVVRWGFDLGAFGLVGAAAAAAFAVLPADGVALVLLAGPAAGLTYYVVNAVLLSVVMGLSEGIRPTQAWRERLAWLWPHFAIYGALGAGVVVLADRIGAATAAVFLVPLVAVWISQKQYVDRVRRSVGEARRRNDELARANRDLQRLLDEKRALLQRMQRSYLSTITSLARTIEAKDPYTGGHTERVAGLAVLLAEDLGLTPDQRRAVEVGAVIHDIGKIGVPDRVLLKPGRLDPEEVGEMRRHPEISSYIVGALELPPIVKQMVRSHHERWDGSGYPDRLEGEEIPMSARILAVADTLDAMTSDRPYRSALPLDEAIAEIRAQSGRQFCPEVVEALLGRLAADPGLRGARRSAAAIAA